MEMPFFCKKVLVRMGIARRLPSVRKLLGPGTGYLKYYSDRVLAAPVEQLLDPVVFPEPTGHAAINLNQAAPWFDSPVTGIRVTADRLGNPPPRGLITLQEDIAEQYHRRDGRSVEPTEEVLVTHGASGAYGVVLDAFVNPGDKVVVFDPSSPLFSVGAKSRRASVCPVPVTSQDGKLRIDFELLARALSGAMLLAISDPGNPLGMEISQEDWVRIAALARKYDVLIFLDESLGRFRFTGSPSPLALLPDSRNRTISAGSLTQGHGLGSARIGWMTGVRHLLRPCSLMQNLTAPYVSTVCQQIALRAITCDEEAFAPVIEEFRSRRNYSQSRLAVMGFDPSTPTCGLFHWVDVRRFGMDGRTFAEKLSRSCDVLVGPGDVYGECGKDHIRIGYAIEDGRLREGLSRMAAFISHLKPSEPGELVAARIRYDLPRTSEPHILPASKSLADERAASFSRV